MNAPLSVASVRQGGRSFEEVTEGCLARVREPAGEGERAYTTLLEAPALAQARASDGRGREARRPLEGVPVSVKNLFDVAGVTTLAGSRLLADEPPAARDSEVVRRLRAAGAVLIGLTNMTEFAFSGVGLNPHYGTPANPWDRGTGRIPGGSSAGAAVSVTDGMAAAAIGTDTGGSVRIPAALCGLAGYKPTARRVPVSGMVPLSPSLDSVGVLGATLGCCSALAGVLDDTPLTLWPPRPLRRLRLGVVANYVTTEMDAAVSAAYGRALARIAEAGAVLEEISIPALEEIPAANAKGGFAAAEAHAWHRPWLDRAAEYDPRVLARILRGAEMAACDYLDLLAARARIQAQVLQAARRFDALLSPTVPIVAPPFSAFAEDAAFARLNLLLLRNPSLVNFIDGAAITLPCHGPGEAPVGMMLWNGPQSDEQVLRAGFAVEAALAG